LKILSSKITLSLCLFLSSSTIFANTFLPPNLAFKPTLQGNVVTIHIADGYYLYKDKISVLSQEKSVNFTFNNNAIIKTFKNNGTFSVYLEKAQLLLPQKLKGPIVIRYQGCSSEGLCYPPQQTVLKAK
jgi:thiol:disulfide interchange protein